MKSSAMPARTSMARPACAQPAHYAPLIRREPVRRLAAAHAQDLADAGLSAQQRLAPRPGGEHIDGTPKSRMQCPKQRGQQHHVAEGAAADHERPPAVMRGLGNSTLHEFSAMRRIEAAPWSREYN